MIFVVMFPCQSFPSIPFFFLICPLSRAAAQGDQATTAQKVAFSPIASAFLPKIQYDINLSLKFLYYQKFQSRAEQRTAMKLQQFFD